MKQIIAPPDKRSIKNDLELPNKTKQKPSNELKKIYSKEEDK